MGHLSLGFCCKCFGIKSGKDPLATQVAFGTVKALSGFAINDVMVTADITFGDPSHQNVNFGGGFIHYNQSDLGRGSSSMGVSSIRDEEKSVSRRSFDSIDSMGTVELKSDEQQRMTENQLEAWQLTNHILDLLTNSGLKYSGDPRIIRYKIYSNQTLSDYRLVDILCKNPNSHSNRVREELIKCLTDFNRHLTEFTLHLFDINAYHLSNTAIRVSSNIEDAINLLEKSHIDPLQQQLLIQKLRELKIFAFKAEIEKKLSNPETQQECMRILKKFLIATNLVGEDRAMQMQQEELIEFLVSNL